MIIYQGSLKLLSVPAYVQSVQRADIYRMTWNIDTKDSLSFCLYISTLNVAREDWPSSPQNDILFLISSRVKQKPFSFFFVTFIFICQETCVHGADSKRELDAYRILHIRTLHTLPFIKHNNGFQIIHLKYTINVRPVTKSMMSQKSY